MASRPASPPRAGKLVTLRAKPITDPAEQAAMERIYFSDKVVTPDEVPAGPSIIQQFFNHLSTDAKLELLGGLAARLSADSQGKLVAQLLASLPPAGRRKLEAAIRSRSKAS
jgi:hypothetical protein